ncbi:MAG TPA: type I restriction endonuclease subunit R [Cyclobacteriaceae bacterium]|nr:type I restriction endonuclease subunit R [Cyclobacteriaceae bacterium]
MQSEAALENELISQLVRLGYTSVVVHDGETLLSNLQTQLERFNQTNFTPREFGSILNHLAKGTVFEKSRSLRDRYNLPREDGTNFYVRFFNNEDWKQNLFQVTNQVKQEGSFLNRYDVTLLVNGLPLVQIELKRRGIEVKEAFNQINRYQKHSFWSNHGLFQYVQLFVISNGVNTKYLANNPLQSVLQTFYWADSENRIITELSEFTKQFLDPDHLGKFIAHYVVMNETFKTMMVLRPYQLFAVEAIIRQVSTGNQNGYIWHTTGSGKTLTSFKASQVIMDLPQVHKVVFVVDRKDLDYQTMNEFNAFKKDSVDVTNNTASLVRQLTDDTRLVLTTIQKLNIAISRIHFEKQLTSLQDKKVVFIFDECHRSQFGDTHQRIKSYFSKAQMFGFTGTPIFADNANRNELGKRTTKDLFGECLHKYVITDAIRDQNVLRFGVEYIGRYKQKGNTFMDIEVEDIDRPEVLNDPKRLDKIADYIIQRHDQKTFNREFSSLFAVSSIENLIKYYEIFKERNKALENKLRIAAIFTYGTNEDDEDAQDLLPDEQLAMAAEPKPGYESKHTRDKLEEFIGDYNKMYGTSFSTKDGEQFEGYFKDIGKRLKDREKATFNDEKDRLDILLVVNMFLTGFDAKKVNTLYVDKNLRHHGVIQAYSRTNRILGEKKSQGNILCFRNLKKATDEAITLFSNKEAIEEVILPPYGVIAKRFEEALKELLTLVPTWQSVDLLHGEEEEAAFVKLFRALLRAKNVLESYSDFTWEGLGIDEETFINYQTKYIDLYSKVQRDNAKEKTSILNDIDFEVELIHRDLINVAYIIKLLAKLKQAKTSEAQRQKKAILDLLGSEIQLRSKRELIEKFIEENLPKISDADSIQDEFEKYWEEQKVLALAKLCDEESLDKEQFKSLIEAYIFSGQTPLRDDVLKCLGDRPSILQAREIGDRIISKMKEFVEVFEAGMVA